jgi:paxillin
VTAEYEAVEPTELSISLEDMLIIGETEGGWSHATNIKSGKSGWIPADFVDKVEVAPSPPPAVEPSPPQPTAVVKPAIVPAASASAASTTSAPAKGGFRPPSEGSSFRPPSALAAAPPSNAAAQMDPKTRLAEQEGAEAAAFAALADAQKATGTVDPNLPVCHGCKVNVFPGQPYVAIKERTFHAEHFACVTCKKSLQGVPVIEKDDKFYCKDDFYNEFGKKCGHCEQPLMGQYMEALGKCWHPEHFVCSECSAPFTSLTFREHDNRPYCEEDYQKLFGEWCAKCGKPIDDQVVVAMEKKFHTECFVCEDGKHKIGEGEHFYLHFDKVYCPKHFESLFTAKCDVCKKELDAGYTKQEGKSYHSQCVPKEEKKAQAAAAVSTPASASSTVYFPFLVLKQNKWPKGAVDITKKEDYLSPEDFQQLFGMTKAQFNALPSWKRKDKKQKAGLF